MNGRNFRNALAHVGAENKSDGGGATTPPQSMVERAAQGSATHRRSNLATHSHALFTATTASGLGSSRVLAPAVEANLLEDEIVPVPRLPMEDEIVVAWVQVLILLNAIIKAAQVGNFASYFSSDLQRTSRVVGGLLTTYITWLNFSSSSFISDIVFEIAVNLTSEKWHDRLAASNNEDRAHLIQIIQFGVCK